MIASQSTAQPATRGIRISKTLLILLLVKSLYLLFAYFVFSRMTQLGDTPRYLSSDRSFAPDVFLFSTSMMNWSGGIFGRVFGTELLANLPAVALSAYGIAYCLVRMQISQSAKTFLMLMLMTPTLGIWTSIHSKEAVTTFALGVLMGWYIEFVNGGRSRPRIIELLACYLVALFKPQYIPAIGALFVSTIHARRRGAGWGTVAIGVAIFSFGIGALYLLRDVLDLVTKNMFLHFVSPDAAATRPDDFFDSEHAFLRRAGYGMILAFWGPTLSEATSSPAHAVAFFESALVVATFGMLLWVGTANFRRTHRLSAVALTAPALAVFWLLFAHYPFGVFNPGSAIRYRAGFLSFLILLVGYFCLDRRANRRPSNAQALAKS